MLTPFQTLTWRERQVCDLVTAGWSNAEVGIRLRCSRATVKRHLESVLGKYGAKNRTVLAVSRTRELLSQSTSHMAHVLDETTSYNHHV